MQSDRNQENNYIPDFGCSQFVVGAISTLSSGQLPEAPKTEDLEAKFTEMQSAIEKLRVYEGKIFTQGELNRRHIEEGLTQALSQAREVIKQLQPFKLYGISTTLEAEQKLGQIKELGKLIEDQLSNLTDTAKKNERMVGLAVMNQTEHAGKARQFGKTVNRTLESASDFFETAAANVAEFRSSVEKVHSQMTVDESRNEPIKNLGERDGYYKIYEHGPFFSSYVTVPGIWKTKESKGNAAIKKGSEAGSDRKQSESSQSQKSLTNQKDPPALDDKASTQSSPKEQGVVSEKNDKLERPLLEKKSESPAQSESKKDVVSVADAKASNHTDPELLKKFKDFQKDGAAAPSQLKISRLRAQMKEDRDDIEAIKKRLAELEQPAQKPPFFSWQFRPLTMVAEYFEKGGLVKQLAKLEAGLDRALFEHKQLHKESIELARDKFAGKSFVVPRDNPEGIPAIIFKASIPASKVETLISFDELCKNIKDHAPKIINFRDEIEIAHSNGKRLVYQVRADGKVTVFADQGGGLKRLGISWNDDALKLAKVFMVSGNIPYRKSTYEEKRYIPDRGFLSRDQAAK